jgi:hypothetical protein
MPRGTRPPGPCSLALRIAHGSSLEQAFDAARRNHDAVAVRTVATARLVAVWAYAVSTLGVSA